MTAVPPPAPACFPSFCQIGTGDWRWTATRQPGQVRKGSSPNEVRIRVALSLLPVFFERIAQKAATFALSARVLEVYSAKDGCRFCNQDAREANDRDGRKTLNWRIDR